MVRGHFVLRVELDRGDLVIVPSGRLKPRISAKTAEALFAATDVVDGSYRFAVLGLGLATVSGDVASAPTPSTGPSTTTSTTQLPTTTTASTTTATSPSGSTTTSTTLIAPPATPTLPHYDHRLAWVGIAWDANCPGASGGSHLATRYVVVIFDAQTGGSVIAYTSRSTVACSGPVLPPTISRPSELVSVPWQPIAPSRTAVRVTMPACSTYFGWTEVPGPSASSIQVVASKPFDPECGSRADNVQDIDNVVPLGTAQTQVLHAALGPVDGLQTLPGG